LARALRSGRGGLRGIEATGREIGHELAPAVGRQGAGALQEALTALGFDPVRTAGAASEPGERVTLCLGNCPYAAVVHENQPAVCALHRGLTHGLVERLIPGARLIAFEPHDPDEAGCLVGVAGAGVRS
ncbi:MAG: hypothetical protein ACRDL5_14315, partial [Solirubrobacteraceae bacterium]